MNTQLILPPTPAQLVMKNFQLQRYEEGDESAAPLLQVVSTSAAPEEQDPERLNVCSKERSQHLMRAEKAGAAYWKQNHKCFDDQATGHSKFETCAYVIKPEAQVFETPGMGLELSCLNSFIGAAYT